MSTKPETRLVKKMMEALVEDGGFYIKIHGGMFQRAGIADILGIKDGRFIAIEVKIPTNTKGPYGNGLTALQAKFLKAIKKHGGLCGVATSIGEAFQIVKGKNKYVCSRRKD